MTFSFFCNRRCFSSSLAATSFIWLKLFAYSLVLATWISSINFLLLEESDLREGC